MITPLSRKVSESCMYVTGSAGSKLGRSPFTCVVHSCRPNCLFLSIVSKCSFSICLKHCRKYMESLNLFFIWCFSIAASGKAKVKPVLQMIASSEKRKAFELKELLTGKLSNGVQTISVETTKKVVN